MATLINDPTDLLLGPDGDLVIPLQFVRGLAGVVQRVRIRLRLVRGEYFMNLSAGVPWLQTSTVSRTDSLLGSKFNRPRVLSEIRKAIESTPDVLGVKSMDATYDPTTRRASIKWEARTTFGDTPLDVFAFVPTIGA